MEVIDIVMLCIVVILVVMVLKSKNPQSDISPQLIDLKNQINELQTKQLESQTSSRTQQQELLINTQKELREELRYISNTVNEGMHTNQSSITTQINELKTKQLESQTSSLAQQQELLLNTQKELGVQLRSISNMISEGMHTNQSSITTQLNNSTKVINDIQKQLGSLEVTAKNIQAIGSDISSLQEILKAPKLRGNLGEYLLEELLKEIFPASNYEIKYNFKNKTQVDAVIKLGEGIVPVDSKFPLESFLRLVSTDNENDKKRYKKEFVSSVKLKIDEIASKYINPSEGTFDFAMMYIPAENVFYETIINDSLTNKEYEIFNYAIQKHVIPVSPNSFYAYLMALVHGLKGFRIEKQAKQIIGELSNVQNSFGEFYQDFTLAGRHLNNAQSKYEDSLKKAKNFNDKIGQITGNKFDLVE